MTPDSLSPTERYVLGLIGQSLCLSALGFLHRDTIASLQEKGLVDWRTDRLALTEQGVNLMLGREGTIAF